MTESAIRPPLGELRRGERIAPFTIRISTDDVRAYLEATGERSPVWETHVPPIALGAFGLAGLMERVLIPAGIVHTGQEYEFHRPVVHDEPLDVHIVVSSRVERRGTIVTAFETEWRSGGDVVGTARTTVLILPTNGDA